MKRILALFMVLVAFTVSAQTQTTGNLISGAPTGTTPYTGTGEGFSGGSVPGYNATNNTIYFGYNQGTAAHAIAINNALQGSGVQVNGIRYGMSYLNGANSYGTLGLNVNITSNTGQTLQSYNHSFNTLNDNWQQFDQTQTFTNPYALSNMGTATMSITGKDSRWWAGYYGPQVKDPYLKLTYSADPCVTNPAASPNCQNYNTVSISDNLVPHPGAYAYGGYNIDQSYAINQALNQSGAGVMIHGFQWGYIANTNGPYCVNNSANGCLEVKTPTVTTSVSITDNTGANIYSVDRTYSNSYNTTNYSYLFPTSRNLSTLGRFNFTGTTNDQSAFIGEMWSKSLYTPDPCVVNPQSDPACAGYKTFYNIGDDGWAQVNLPFNFPFYGRTFNTSYMFSNGVVGFLDPNANSYCCDGVNLKSNPGSSWNFAIYALQTDLIAGNPNARFYTQSDNSYMKYTWENINEFGSNNLNTFSATIKPTGFIGLNYQQVNVQSHNVTIGTAGDISLGQYSQAYTGPGADLQGLNLVTAPGTYKFTFTGTEVDVCTINPLSSPSCPGYTTAMCQSNPLFSPVCPGYQEAYFYQQCSADVFYNTACPGYAAAYHDLQCSINPLYANDCTGYQQAYHDQQCSINPLYATDCQGYTTAKSECDANPLNHEYCPAYRTASATCLVNPLSNSLCSGYVAASTTCLANPLTYSYCPTYQVTQEQCTSNQLTYSYCPSYQTTLQYCSTDPLSNSMCPTYTQSLSACTANPLGNSYCPGYQTAVSDCSSNVLNHNYCPGYQTALNTCSTNPLSNSLCTGYQTATTECSSNPLLHTYCTAYNTTLASCATNPQSNTMCPGYSVMSASSSSSSSSTSGDTSTTTGVSSPTPSSSITVVNVAPTPVQTPVQQATSTPSTTSVTSVTSVNSVIAPPPVAGPTNMAGPAPSNPPAKEQGPAKDAPANDSKTAQADPKPANNERQAGNGNRPASPQNRADERKSAEAKAQQANENMKNATRMEDQVAAQGAVVNSMAFVPGFAAYQNSIVPDINQLRMARQYSKPPVDNNRTQRLLGGAQERRWNEMVDSQYNNYNRGN